MALNDSKHQVSEIIERRDKNRDWLRINIWPEIMETFRNIKCRTKPIYKLDAHGKPTQEEDKTRTNVCMPESSIIHRKNWARLSGQPYRLRYFGGTDPSIADRLSALASQQFERSNEWKQDRLVVGWAEAIGFGYSKLTWDTLCYGRSVEPGNVPTMKLKRRLIDPEDNGRVLFNDRRAIQQALGTSEDEINQMVAELGYKMTDIEVAKSAAALANEITVERQLRKYEGPVVKAIFPGDLFFDHNYLALDDADAVIEQYRESDLWLLKQVKTLKYEDENGQMVPAFDPEAVKALLDLDPEPMKKSIEYDLKQQLEATVGRNQNDGLGDLPRHLRVRKKYNILEEHKLGDDGRVWITWVSEDYREKPLGTMPYPFDLYGKYVYTELITLPDLISAYGDSTPRQLRFLNAMHNMTVAQNFDYVTNVLKPFVKRLENVEVANEAVVRNYGRELVVPRMDALAFEQMPQLPPSAFEREAQILRMEALCEPAMNTVDTGSDSNPMAGKLATTAMINAKSGDMLMNFKIAGRDGYLRELEQKKLWMNQQAATEEWKIESRFMQRESLDQLDQMPQEQRPQWALSGRFGKVVATRLDPYEIQEDLQVEPEAMSYLTVDDELRRAAVNDVAQIAMQAPGIIDLRKVARMALGTIRGIGNPDEYLMPEQPPNPGADMKKSLSLSVKFETLPLDVQNQLFSEMGIQRPPEQVQAEQTAEGLQQMSDMADNAENLTSTSQDVYQMGNETPQQAGKELRQ